MISRAEWRWAAGMAALVMALTTLPYVVGTEAQAGGWRFGGFVLGTDDGNSYIAKMGQGARGAWLFTLPYSSEPQRGVLFYTFYLLLGKLAGPSHDARVVAYHIARVVLGFALLLASYLFLAELLPEVGQRRLGLVLVAAGGGLGWLLTLFGRAYLLGSLPVDFISPEAYTFLMLYALPHLAAARCLFLLGLLAYLRGKGAAAGVALLGVGLIQPLYVLVAWAVLGIDIVLAWATRIRNSPIRNSPIPNSPIRNSLLAMPKFSTWPIAGLISSLPVAYSVYAFTTDPLLKQWIVQNFLPSPHPLHYLLGYGVYLVPAVWGWRALARRSPGLARFVGGWALAIPVLLYAPLSTQRRLIEGFQLPLVSLAVLGLASVGHRLRLWMLPLFLALTLPTSALLLAGGAQVARTPAEPVFHPADQLAAFDWLSRHAAPGQVVLSAFETGNALPAYTPLVAYIGHGPETVFLAAKEQRVSAFYRTATSDAERRRLLADGRIAFVIFGPHERGLGDFDPESVGYLQRRFAYGDYAVFAVTP